jgi:NhaP-type Na+/H+ or K+/H+ antiporter
VAQEVCECPMAFAAGELPDLVHHREQALLGWVGVGGSFPVFASLGAALDAPAEEVEQSFALDLGPLGSLFC